MKHKFRKDGIFNLWFYNSSHFLHILVDSLHLEPGIQNVADPTDPDAKHCSIVFIVFIFGRWIRLDDTKHGDILVSMIWKPITQNTGIPPPSVQFPPSSSLPTSYFPKLPLLPKLWDYRRLTWSNDQYVKYHS